MVAGHTGVAGHIAAAGHIVAVDHVVAVDHNLAARDTPAVHIGTVGCSPGCIGLDLERGNRPGHRSPGSGCNGYRSRTFLLE